MKYNGPKYYKAQGKESAYDALLNIIDSLQQEQPEGICSKCIHHGKDDDYCYNPHGGMQSLINENGVYECTGFCEKEQEQPEVDFEQELYKHFGQVKDFTLGMQIGKYFYELGKNSK